ncbi:type VI secretion system baseplate subunit TssE [Beijerinckia mobilis]|uniref:type VI secretion system baseplate subunit TssE n=1 Tax=Beijerinckia mobilis TaxID=231434 RepID=UPI0012EC2966|nr:GPW/gp25 family protein [Beijerinckia mobilis]
MGSTTDNRRDMRLSPPLMYVFRSAYHDRKEEARAEAKRKAIIRDGGDLPLDRKTRPERTPINERELKLEVERDIGSLMNHISLDSTVNLEQFPHVRNSILNFGFSDIAHRSLDELESSDLDGEIVAVLELFEPRLVRGSVRVTRDTTVEPGSLELRYVVDGHLVCQPLNVPIEFVARIDLASGKLNIARR